MKKLLKRLCSAMVAAVMVMTMAPAAFAADGGAQFQNGPYLLAPKTNSMVVVWESTEKVSATIAYGTDESKLCDPIKVEIDADAPDFKGSKMNLFHYKLDNLTPGTRYYYEVKLEGGATYVANLHLQTEVFGYLAALYHRAVLAALCFVVLVDDRLCREIKRTG